MGVEFIGALGTLAVAASGAYVAYHQGRRVQRQVIVDLAAAVDQRTERLLERLDGQLERLEAQSAEQRRRILEQAEQLEQAHRLLWRMREVVQRLIRELRKHDSQVAARLERELNEVERPAATASPLVVVPAGEHPSNDPQES